MSSSNIFILSLLSLSLFLAQHVEASIARKAQDAFDKGDYVRAEKLYAEASEKNTEKKELLFNAGVSALANGELDSAKNAFDGAITTDDINLQESTYYNRGNTLYQLGRRELDTNPQSTIESWEASVNDFESALSLNPENIGAQQNKDEVSRLLEELKKLLEQNQQNNQDQNEDNEDQKDQDQEQQNKDQDKQDENKKDQNNKGDQQDQSKADQNNEQQEQNEPQDQQQEQPQKNEEKADQPKDGQKNEEQKPAQQPQQKEASDQDKQEAMRLLDSLKNEDGDFKELFYKLQNPETDEATDKDW